ncbi:MAG: glycosyltransferase [Phyllobacteriaceae bacterium]|nr:glycosyltransferase [Phyllobacteriaceae bacterium]
MLSVIIETANHEEGLARTLSPLVGGLVEGVVREVIVCDGGSADATLKVAEHAGCRVVSGGVAEAIRAAKSDWLLFLEPGARPVGDWLDPLVGHMARQTMPAQFSRSRESRPRLFARVFSTALSTGLLIRKPQALARLKSATSAEALARGLAVKRLTAELAVAPGR